MRVAVIGAGAAGLTAAYRLAGDGLDVDVFEAGDAVGGLARSITLWGQRVDLGPHRFFSSDPRVNKLWLEVVGRDYRMIDRLTRIWYRDRFFHYPLKAGDALKNLGAFEAARCVASYGRVRALRKLAPRDDDGSFESWVTDRFGRRLYGIFFKTYSEKLWGIPCTELDADFAAQRIKKLSLSEAIRNAMKGGGSTEHKTLVDRFAFPLHGSGVAYERLADGIVARGGRVRVRAPVKGIRVEGGNVVGIDLADGETWRGDHVISTMPFTQMVRSLPDAPEAVRRATDALTFRNTILVYLHVEGSGLFPDQWLYVHSNEVRMGRITNFRNWTPELYGDSPNTILAIEYWCYDDDAEWREDDAALIARATAEMGKTGLLEGRRVLDGHVVRLRRCYPVYKRGYREHVDTITSWLRTFPNLTPIGRYGAFKYNNQDHSILMGLLAAENIAHAAGHDLWGINTDYEYQEAALITETGLEYKAAAK